MRKILLSLLFFAMCITILAAPASAQGPVVRAVFFYSPTCPHCHVVIKETLLPMQKQYGDQLEIVAINVDLLEGKLLYDAYIKQYNPPSQGWPALIVENTVMVGDVDIPAQFPLLVEAGLASGGIDWPDFPELLAAVADNEWQTNPSGSALLVVSKALAAEGQDTFLARVTAFFMLASVGFAVVKVFIGEHAMFDLDREKKSQLEGWIVPALIVLGTGIAAYLAYTHYTSAEVVCGPFGGCELVQSSEYAMFLGIPVAALGLAGYLGSAALWVMNRSSEARTANTALLLFFAAALAGTIFSIYLTYLEIAVIKAECIWCLASALVFSLLLAVISSQIPVIASSRRLRSRRASRR